MNPQPADEESVALSSSGAGFHGVVFTILLTTVPGVMPRTSTDIPPSLYRATDPEWLLADSGMLSLTRQRERESSPQTLRRAITTWGDSTAAAPVEEEEEGSGQSDKTA